MAPSWPIRFRFDSDKFIHLVAYLAQQCAELDILKTVKLLYLIDRYHLVRFGRPILGDRYCHLPWGPVPSAAYDRLKETHEDYPDVWGITAHKAELLKYVNIETPGRYPIFSSKEEPNLEYFSENEIQSINEIIRKFGSYRGIDLKDIVSKHPTCTKTRQPDPIDYRLFFEDNAAAKGEAYDIMESEQEDRDFAEGYSY